MANFLTKIINIVFPETCIECGKKDTLFCSKCMSKTPYPDNKNRKEILAAASYKSPIVKKAIWTLKYKKAKKISKPLAGLIYQRLTKKQFLNKKDTLIIPIPLSKKRLRKRGFNQAEEIAKHLSDSMSVKLETSVLYRIKHTESQVIVKDREKRLKNLKGAFVIKNPQVVKNKHIILIDDVSTTGATLKEAADVFKNTKAKKITKIVVAK
jgi:competence protein ComFC